MSKTSLGMGKCWYEDCDEWAICKVNNTPVCENHIDEHLSHFKKSAMFGNLLAKESEGTT